MNNGQERFFNFIIDRVEEQNQGKAKELLSESFAKQDNSTFNSEYMDAFIPKRLQLIKPECIEEVKSVMTNNKT
ncbi:hypothetical protein UT300003_26020 [Clostridium sardiniense]